MNTLEIKFDSPAQLEAFKEAARLQGVTPQELAKRTLVGVTKYLAEEWTKTYREKPPFLKP